MIKKYFVGLTSFRKAHKAINQYKLWRFVLLPGLFNLLLLIGLMISFASFQSNLNLAFGEECGLSDTWDWLCVLGQYSSGFLSVLFKIVVMVAMLFLYFLIYKYVIIMVFSPFFSMMIDKIHFGETGEDQPFSWEQFRKDFVRGIKVALRLGLAELFFTLLSMLILLIPVVQAIQPVIVFFIAAYYMGANMLDYTQEKFQLTYSESIRYSQKNRALASGLGSGFQLLNFIPVLGWMFAPAYTVAAAYYAYVEYPKESLKA
jgi:CysZ protein